MNSMVPCRRLFYAGNRLPGLEFRQVSREDVRADKMHESKRMIKKLYRNNKKYNYYDIKKSAKLNRHSALHFYLYKRQD